MKSKQIKKEIKVEDLVADPIKWRVRKLFRNKPVPHLEKIKSSQSQ